MILCSNPKEQYLSHKSEIKEAIDRVLESGWYILGSEVKAFEEEFAKFVGTTYAVGVASGTDALFLSLKAFDIGSGDEVITVSHTATATVSAIEATGAKVIFVDIEEEYFGMDVTQVEALISSRTKAIMPVHIYGHPCEMDTLVAIAKKHKLHLIEDCAQASGAKYKNRDVGSIGDLGAFSFFPTKNLGALGDGGAITTDSKILHDKLMMLRQYGWNETRESQFQGYNSRLDEMQAAILRVKLNYLREDIEKRNIVASWYGKYLQKTNIVLPIVEKNSYHAYHLYVVKTDYRDELMAYLKAHDILALVHYSQAVHHQKSYKIKGSLVNTNKSVSQILSLPMYPELSEGEVQNIAMYIVDFAKKRGENSL